ncbi:MAG: hypothetical protein IKS51_00585 [Erysipelotrichaceae bacterium]|nr:hypothetical protein [Erysipelotrichaceae bacterium]
MNLLIHDLNHEELNKIFPDLSGWEVISDNGTIRPCVGCFGCWNKDPGHCIVTDGYDNMGSLIHHAEEVTVISRYTYGGFSSFVKNVFDRCLAYVLPHFEIIDNETHHQKRYEEDKPFTFIFYGHRLSNEEKKSAERYVEAVCTNIRGYVKELIFWDHEDDSRQVSVLPNETEGKIALLNASMRQGNSRKLGLELQKKLKQENELIEIAPYVRKPETLMERLEDVPVIVLCTPLYVDGLPSQLIRLLETFEKRYHGTAKRIYVLANMGLYESRQLVNLFDAIRQWCDRMGFAYCGGLGVSAGELAGGFLDFSQIEKWPLNKINEGIAALAETIDKRKKMDNIYSGPYRFPRSLYVAIANSGWKRMAKKNGLKNEDLFRRL